MTKLTITQARKELPAQVSEYVIGLAKAHRTRAISFQQVAKVYLDEDGRYNALVNGEWRSVRIGGEWGGMENAGLIAKDMPLPVGAFVVEAQIFLGKYFITIYHNNGIAQVN